jgi:hypothetical protein
MWIWRQIESILETRFEMIFPRIPEGGAIAAGKSPAVPFYD